MATKRLQKSLGINQEKIFPYGLLLPAITVLVLAQIYPTLYSIYMSFNKLKAGNLNWIGLANYIRLLNSGDFINSLGKTFIYSGGYLLLTLVLAMCVALLLNQRVFLTPVYLTILFIPWVLSDVVSGTVWRWMFQQDYGLVQVLLNPLINRVTLLSNNVGAMLIMILSSTWRNLAFTTIVLLGALQTVSSEIKEAAAMDGTSNFRFFWNFTIPIIKPTILVITLLTSIGGINSLGLILATTNGGPGNATTTTSVLLYREAWKYGDFGTASAIAVFMFFINMALAILYFRVLKEKN
ncbi:MAG: sugar ABC transporter permease [Spirochaetales bacterium]|nr:sugar ABC transporter permease [Spirochaetales bacterium]